MLTTHVGSLPRLTEPDPQADETAHLRAAVHAVVRRQRDLGIDLINEGEYTKGAGWLEYHRPTSSSIRSWCRNGLGGLPAASAPRTSLLGPIAGSADARIHRSHGQSCARWQRARTSQRSACSVLPGGE